MPRPIQLLTVFVSGTGEMAAEKTAIRKTIQNLSLRLEKAVGVSLRVLSWPEDFRPGVNTDPQGEINRQIGDDYDIYVGILGSRFGATTPRSESGTAEEFEKAISRFHADSTSMRILFYFKTTSESQFDLDMEQLILVKQFRNGLGARGVLYRDFRDTAQFVDLIGDHLHSLVIDEWAGEKWQGVPRSHSPEASTPNVSDVEGVVSESVESVLPGTDTFYGDDEELGLLELLDVFHESARRLSETLAGIVGDMGMMSDNLRARTEEAILVQEAQAPLRQVGGSRSSQELVQRSIAVIDVAAGNLDDFAGAMAVRMEAYATNQQLMFESYRKVIVSSEEVGGLDRTADVAALQELIAVLLSSREGVGSMQASINGVPSLTRKFKKAKRRVLQLLGRFVAELSFTVSEAREVISMIGGDDDAAGA